MDASRCSLETSLTLRMLTQAGNFTYLTIRGSGHMVRVHRVELHRLLPRCL